MSAGMNPYSQARFPSASYHRAGAVGAFQCAGQVYAGRSDQ